MCQSCSANSSLLFHEITLQMVAVDTEILTETNPTGSQECFVDFGYCCQCGWPDNYWLNQTTREINHRSTYVPIPFFTSWYQFWYPSNIWNKYINKKTVYIIFYQLNTTYPPWILYYGFARSYTCCPSFLATRAVGLHNKVNIYICIAIIVMDVTIAMWFIFMMMLDLLGSTG